MEQNPEPDRPIRLIWNPSLTYLTGFMVVSEALGWATVTEKHAAPYGPHVVERVFACPPGGGGVYCWKAGDVCQLREGFAEHGNPVLCGSPADLVPTLLREYARFLQQKASHLFPADL